MKVLRSKFGGSIRLPASVLEYVHEALEMPFPNVWADAQFHFDDVLDMGDDSYECSFNGFSFMVSDTCSDGVVLLWRSDNGEETSAWLLSRSEPSTCEKLDADDERMPKTPRILDYFETPRFYVNDDDKDLSFPSYAERISSDSESESESESDAEIRTSYVQDGVFASPTEGWLSFLRGGETIGTSIRFRDKEANYQYGLYAKDKITEWVRQESLWLQDLVHSVRDDVPGDNMVQLDSHHFPTASDAALLRKSMVLSNKVRAVFKFSGPFFWWKASESAYLLVINSKGMPDGIGKILFGDFTNETPSKSLYSHLTKILVDFLSGNLITSPLKTRVVRTNELKEPFALDPSKYVR